MNALAAAEFGQVRCSSICPQGRRAEPVPTSMFSTLAAGSMKSTPKERGKFMTDVRAIGSEVARGLGWPSVIIQRHDLGWPGVSRETDSDLIPRPKKTGRGELAGAPSPPERSESTPPPSESDARSVGLVTDPDAISPGSHVAGDDGRTSGEPVQPADEVSRSTTDRSFDKGEQVDWGPSHTADQSPAPAPLENIISEPNAEPRISPESHSRHDSGAAVNSVGAALESAGVLTISPDRLAEPMPRNGLDVQESVSVDDMETDAVPRILDADGWQEEAAADPKDSPPRVSHETARQMPAPAQTRVMVVANQKGGVGKTTTSVNIAAALALGGLRVVVIDLDPQGNASTALGIDHSPGTPGTYEVLISGAPIADHLIESPEAQGLRVLPATIDLAGAEIELVPVVARENRLLRAINTYLRTNEVDYVILDCPPSLGLLTLNALVAAGEILIPIQCEYYALEGVSQLMRTIDLVQAELNDRLTLSTVLLTMFDARTRLAAQVADEVRKHFAGQTLPTVIPRSVRISEAPSYGQTVLTYHPESTGAISYREAAHEIARRGAKESA
jgi:chromosome partitioning protein